MDVETYHVKKGWLSMDITCNNCGKFNKEKKQIGEHWICQDCKQEADDKRESDRED
jgi:transposase-like protein